MPKGQRLALSGLTTAVLFSGYFSAYKNKAMRVSFFLKAFCSCLLLGLLYSCSAQSKTAALHKTVPLRRQPHARSSTCRC
jgi:hypothetical protein